MLEIIEEIIGSEAILLMMGGMYIVLNYWWRIKYLK